MACWWGRSRISKEDCNHLISKEDEQNRRELHRLRAGVREGGGALCGSAAVAQEEEGCLEHVALAKRVPNWRIGRDVLQRERAQPLLLQVDATVVTGLGSSD
jgi:hypothetical protein